MNKYNLRLVELFKENISDSEISEIIHNEYGIRLSSLIIKNKRAPSYINKIQNTEKQDITDKVNKIVEVLQKNCYSPKSAREISEILRKDFSLRLSKKEVNQIINSNIRNKIEHCRKTFQYSLKSNEPEFDFNSINQGSLIDDILNNYQKEDVISFFQSFFKEKYILIKTGNEKLDYLIKSVVKDNDITECEERFLKQKAVELGIEQNLIELAKKSLYSNNPYLDNLIHIIFEDGVITSEELEFLKEKSEEHNFSKSFVNKRFWTTGVSLFLDHLRKIDGFDKFILLFFIGQKLNSSLIKQEMWVFTNMNIFSSNSIEQIIQAGNIEIEKIVANQIKEEFRSDPNEILTIIERKIKLDEVKINGNLINGEKNLDKNHLEATELFRILEREKRRIGTPDANLLAENIKYEIENHLWD